MKKLLLLLISVISLTFSCKEANEGGFTSRSVKADISEALKGTVWVASSKDPFYEKMEMIDGDFIATVKSGGTITLAFEVSNVNGTMTKLPDYYVLTLKSHNLNEEILLKNNYATLEHSVRLNPEYNQKKWTKFAKDN